MFNPKAGGIIAIAAFFLSFLIGLVSRTAMPMLIVRAVLFAVFFFILSGVISLLVKRFLPELLAGDRPAEEPDFLSGSRINIMEGDSAGPSENSPLPGEPVFMGAQADDSEEEVGDISDLAAKNTGHQSSGGGIQGIGLAGMDQNTQDGYNEEGKLEELTEPGMFTPWEPPIFSGASEPGSFAPERPPASGGGGQPSAPAAGSGQMHKADFAGDPDSGDFFPDLDSMAGAFMPASTNEGSDAGEYPVTASSSKRSRSNKSSGWSGDFNAKDMAAGLRTVLNKEKEG